MYLPNSHIKVLVVFLFFSVHSVTAISSKSDLVKQYLTKSRMHTYQNPDSALYYLGKAKLAAVGNTDDMIIVCCRYADFYTFGSKDLDKALHYLDKAEVLYPNAIEETLGATVFNRKGFVLRNAGYIQAAIESYQKAITIAESANDPKILNNAYVKFASILTELELYEESLFYFSKAVDLANEHAEVDKAFIYRKMAIMYTKQGFYDTSKLYLEDAMEILNKLKGSDKKNSSQVLVNTQLGYVYYYTGKYEQALQIGLANKKWYAEVKKKSKIFPVDLLLGEIYYAINENALALKYALNAYDVIDTEYFSSRKLECVKLISTIYERMGNYKKAYKFLKLHQDFVEKSPKYSLRKNLLREKYFAEFQQQVAQTQLAVQKAQVKQMQLIVIIGISLGILLIGYILYTKRQAHWLQRIQKGVIAQKNMKSKLTKEQKKAAKIQQELNAILQLQSEHNGAQPNAELIQNTLQKLHNSTILTEDDWMTFKSLFQNMYPEFFKNFKTTVQSHSMGDLKLASLIRLNFNTKEIANVLAISPESVRKGKYRLRKKMRFTSEKELQQFIYSL